MVELCNQIFTPQPEDMVLVPVTRRAIANRIQHLSAVVNKITVYGKLKTTFLPMIMLNLRLMIKTNLVKASMFCGVQGLMLHISLKNITYTVHLTEILILLSVNTPFDGCINVVRTCRHF